MMKKMLYQEIYQKTLCNNKEIKNMKILAENSNIYKEQFNLKPLQGGMLWKDMQT